MNVPYGTKVINDMIKKRGFFQNNLIRVSDLLSLLLGTRFPKSFPFVFVIAYPKSGHTWAGQLIADYLQLPAPQNTLLPIGHPAVLFTHHRVWKGFQRGVYVVRDGRAVVNSLINYPGWEGTKGIKKWRLGYTPNKEEMKFLNQNKHSLQSLAALEWKTIIKNINVTKNIFFT